MNKLSNSNSILVDLIRGVSAQLVLIGHLLSFYLDEQFIIVQNLGVVIFFILSGHLISLSAIKANQGKGFDFSKFMINRFVRIYVALIPAIIICYWMDLLSLKLLGIDRVLFNSEFLNIKNAIASMINIPGLPSHFLSFISSGHIDIEPVGSMRPLWTVAIEWWLYLMIAITFVIVRKEKKIAMVFTVLSFLIIIGQLYTEYYIGYFVISIWLLSSAFTISRLKIRASLLFLILSIFSFLLSVNSLDTVKFYEPINMILIFVIYFSMLDVFKTHKYTLKTSIFAKFISSYSYSLYLLHYSLIVFLKPLLNIADIHAATIIFLISNLFAFIFYKAFESKFVILGNYTLKFRTKE